MTKRYTKHIINRIKAYGVLKKGANMKGAKSNNLTIGIWDNTDTYEQAHRFVDKLGPGIHNSVNLLSISREEELFSRITELDILVVDYHLISAGNTMARIKANKVTSVCKLVIVSEKMEGYKYAYKHGAFLFLLKPIKEDDLYDLVSGVLISNTKNALIKVKGEEGYQRIEQKDILFIEADRSCTLVYTKDEVYRSSISLSKWKEVLNPALFIRCHRSYIVNKVKIARVEEDECTLSSGERVLISKNFRDRYVTAQA